MNFWKPILVWDLCIEITYEVGGGLSYSSRCLGVVQALPAQAGSGGGGGLSYSSRCLGVVQALPAQAGSGGGGRLSYSSRCLGVGCVEHLITQFWKCL